MTGWPPQQASSAMTMRAGQPAQAAEHRGPGVAAGLRGAGAGMSSCIGTAWTKSLWGRSPQGLHGWPAAESGSSRRRLAMHKNTISPLYARLRSRLPIVRIALNNRAPSRRSALAGPPSDDRFPGSGMVVMAPGGWALVRPWHAWYTGAPGPADCGADVGDLLQRAWRAVTVSFRAISWEVCLDGGVLRDQFTSDLTRAAYQPHDPGQQTAAAPALDVVNAGPSLACRCGQSGN
jgi:hypothetical protein